jgi:hypothetical protein
MFAQTLQSVRVRTLQRSIDWLMDPAADVVLAPPAVWVMAPPADAAMAPADAAMAAALPKLAQWAFISNIADSIEDLERHAEAMEQYASESSGIDPQFEADVLAAASENFVSASKFQDQLHTRRGALRIANDSANLLDVASSLEKLFNDVFAAAGLASKQFATLPAPGSCVSRLLQQMR